MTIKAFPLVSVVIPTYNREKLIARSVYSVIRQSYSNIEIIIVDDCSNDKTQDVINEINDKRIKFIKLKHNSGPSVARNKGCSIATGEYITFLDSDDVYCPDKIEVQIQEFIKDDTIGMVFCKYTYVEEKTGNALLEVPEANRVEAISNGIDLREEFLRGNLAGTPTIMIKKEVFAQTGGFNETCRTLEDWVFALKIVHSIKVKFIDKSLINVYPSKNGINQIKDMRLVNTCFYILRTYWNMYDNKTIFSYLVSLIFNALCTLSEYEQAAKIRELNNIINVENQPDFSKTVNLLYSCLISRSTNISYWQNVANERMEFINQLQKFINQLQNCKEAQFARDRYKKKLIKESVYAFCTGMLPKLLGVVHSEKIVLYGAGDVSQILIPLCKKSNVTVAFTIDRKPKIIDEISSYTEENIPDKSIPIIITAYDPERTIKQSLQKASFQQIYYLEDFYKS